MRKIKSAIRGVLSAALAMGIGTAVIVGADYMAHGALPTASAAVRADPSFSVTQTTNDGHSAVLMAGSSLDSSQFKSEGTITVTSTGHTGPFTVEFPLPQNWLQYNATFATFAVDTNASATNSTGYAYAACTDSSNKVGKLTVEGAGIDNAQQKITINYTVTTNVVSWSDINIDMQTDAQAEVRDSLDSLAFWSGSPSVSQQTDWSAPGLSMSIQPARTSNDPYPLSPGQSYDNGRVTVSFSGNSKNVLLDTLKFNDGSIASPLTATTFDTSWKIYRHTDQNNLSSPVEYSQTLLAGHQTDFLEGEYATIDFNAKVDLTMLFNHTAKISTTATVNGATQSNGMRYGQKSPESVATWFTVQSTSMEVVSVTSANKTTPDQEVTIGDTVELDVLVKSHGYTMASDVGIVIMNPTELGGKVKFKSLSSDHSDKIKSQTVDANTVDVALNPMFPNDTIHLRIQVECGQLEANTVSLLKDKIIKFNADTTMMNNKPDFAALQAAGTAKHEVQIATPTATIASLATDPTVAVQEPQNVYQQDIVSNLGDTARFQVTFTNTSNRTIKNIVLNDALRAYSRDGDNVVLNPTQTACIDILANTVSLTKVGTDGSTAAVATTNTLTPSNIAEHPWQLTVTPTSALNLDANESLVLQYDAQIGHTEIEASSRNMRGATVRNAPSMTATNLLNNAVSTPATASVKIATAELSTDLSVTKNKIPRGDKTTYVMTVQSVEQRSTTFSDEYAIGLHINTYLSEDARSRGYRHNLDSVKLYYVVNGQVKKVVPASDYTLAWDDTASGGVKETAFTLDIKPNKATSYKIKNVSASQVSTTDSNTNSGDNAGGESVGGESVDAEAVNGGKKSRSAATSADTVLPSEATATKNRGDDVTTIASDIKDGFILTYEGLSDGLPSGFIGELQTTTDAVVRADNASFAMDSEDVVVTGEALMIPETDVTQQATDGANNGTQPTGNGTQGGQNGNATRSNPYAPLISTDVGLPMSFVALLLAAGGWGYTRYRKIRRR